MQPFPIITDKHHKNEAFLMKKNVFNGLVIILVWFGVNRSTFDEDMHAKRFLRFRFHCP